MPNDEMSAEVAALKSGLPVFYGRILAVLERIATALEHPQLRPRAPATPRES
jgi:hypothetical protein